MRGRRGASVGSDAWRGRECDVLHAYEAALDDDPTSPEASQTLDTPLAAGNYSQTFISAYLIPMVSSVWSATFA